MRIQSRRTIDEKREQENSTTKNEEVSQPAPCVFHNKQPAARSIFPPLSRGFCSKNEPTSLAFSLPGVLYFGVHKFGVQSRL